MQATIHSTYRRHVSHAVAASALCLAVLTSPPSLAAQAIEPEQTAAGQDGELEDAEILQLVADLGSEDYATREAASQALIQLGSVVAPYVRRAAESPVLEVNTRSRRILAIISRETFEETIEAFLAGEGGRGGTSLPGWERARDRLGDSTDARRLFADMYRVEPELMASYGEDAAETVSTFSIRIDELYDQHTQRNRINYRLRNQLRYAISDNVKALLFVGADPRLELAPASVTKFKSLFMQNWTKQRLAAAADKDPLRDWLAEWIVHRFSQPHREYEGITFGMQYDVPRTVELALRVLQRGDHDPPHVPVYAILCVGKYGQDCHLPLVEQYLDDENVVLRRRRRVNGRMVDYQTQLRDVALLVLLDRTGQGPKEYGFDEIIRSGDYQALPQSAAFENPEKREDAFSKWYAWRRSHAIFDGEPPAPYEGPVDEALPKASLTTPSTPGEPPPERDTSAETVVEPK